MVEPECVGMTEVTVNVYYDSKMILIKFNSNIKIKN